jgi:superfamily II DNA or RNA helicase
MSQDKHTARKSHDVTAGEIASLEKRLAEISKERVTLLEEIANLKSELESVRDEDNSVTNIASPHTFEPILVDDNRTPPLKSPCEHLTPAWIQLFRSLFRGRDDVYARLWSSKKTGKEGYSPACMYEWVQDICAKPNVKCADCPNREFLPVTEEIIRDHLEGKHTIGVYPLLPEGRCHFLAINFDKEFWREDAAALISTCRLKGVPAVLERSRSGNGAHVWIFFSDTVSAREARNLGCYLITETMSSSHNLPMNSYDRLFPNQDSIPKGGFGNLIALPMQKAAVDNGNTLFLDDGLQPAADQWGLLSSVERMSPAHLDEILRDASRYCQVLGVGTGFAEMDERPWAAKPSGRFKSPPLQGPLPDRINAVLGNLLYVEKEGLSPALLNRIKRVAAFQNPEFYKKQNLRLSTALTPRMICCAEDFPHHIGLPRGCLDELIELLGELGVELDLRDERPMGTDIETCFKGELTPIQKTAVSDLVSYDMGVLVAPPGSGKTVIGAYMIAARGINTLVLVHRRPLLEQWQQRLREFLDVEPSLIGQIGGQKDKRTGFIDIATMQSLYRKKQVADVVTEYGHVIIDECHHIPAVSFEQILRNVRPRNVLGLTATLKRRDGLHPIILMQCGAVRHVSGHRRSDESQTLDRTLIRRDTDFTYETDEADPFIHDIYDGMINDAGRNHLILEDILIALKAGRSPILLTGRREHLQFFASQLDKTVRNMIVLHGGMGAKARRLAMEQLATIPDTEERLIIATGSYVGEGFDDPRLDTLFLVMPVSFDGTITQYSGRLERPFPGKKEVQIYDYVDARVPMLLRMYKKRLRTYREKGYREA